LDIAAVLRASVNTKSALEDEEKVREASYGYRQRRGHEEDHDDPEDESREGLAKR
jgi:hypothetical protein